MNKDTDTVKLLTALGVMKQLVNRGFIHDETELNFTDRALEKITQAPKLKDNVLEWIDEFREIFPKGVRSGGLPVRGDKQSCLKKIRKFLKEYTEYDKDLILKATKNYVENKARDQYNYMQTAHYFIYKNNTSTLAAECENILENEGGNVDSFEESM